MKTAVRLSKTKQKLLQVALKAQHPLEDAIPMLQLILGKAGSGITTVLKSTSPTTVDDDTRNTQQDNGASKLNTQPEPSTSPPTISPNAAQSSAPSPQAQQVTSTSTVPSEATEKEDSHETQIAPRLPSPGCSDQAPEDPSGPPTSAPTDPSSVLRSLVNVALKGGDLVPAHYHANTMPAPLRAWCLDLCRDNMRAYYAKVWGWNDGKKKLELNASVARFIVLHSPEDVRTPIAYTHYRFDGEDGALSLYCYELQVETAHQRKGLGETLMMMLEAIAAHFQMPKVMLTAIKENDGSVQFYKKLGYKLDPTSPDYGNPSKSKGYQIMSKEIA